MKQCHHLLICLLLATVHISPKEWSKQMLFFAKKHRKNCWSTELLISDWFAPWIHQRNGTDVRELLLLQNNSWLTPFGCSDTAWHQVKLCQSPLFTNCILNECWQAKHFTMHQNQAVTVWLSPSDMFLKVAPTVMPLEEIWQCFAACCSSSALSCLVVRWTELHLFVVCNMCALGWKVQGAKFGVGNHVANCCWQEDSSEMKVFKGGFYWVVTIIKLIVWKPWPWWESLGPTQSYFHVYACVYGMNLDLADLLSRDQCFK